MGERPIFTLVPPLPAEPPPPERFPKGARVKVTQRKRATFLEFLAHTEESACPEKPQFGNVLTPLGDAAFVRLDDGAEAVFFEDELEIVENEGRKSGAHADI